MPGDQVAAADKAAATAPSTRPPAPRTGTSVTISNVSKRYGLVRAVDDFSLHVDSGEFVTLLGPSGSGKTSLLMMLAGFLRPDRGSIRFGEREVVLMPPHRRNVAMVFQNYALFPHMDVAGNIAYPLRVRKVDRTAIRRRVGEALELVQLGGYEARRIDELSGGQRQRVALARALVFEPDVLLLDEPLSALDKKLREYMQIELRRLHQRLGMTTIAVTHDQREALTMSDRVVVMNAGQMMQVDAPATLYERPANMFVASFIGETYFLPVEAEGGVVRVGGRTLALGAPPPPGRRLFLLLRPEKLHFIAPGSGAGAGFNLFQGRVRDTVFQGESVVSYIEVEGETEVAVRHLNRDVPAGGPEVPGAEVTLGLAPADTLLLSAES
jgi:putative spermidine/putrescine transport system ATP-binding protein